MNKRQDYEYNAANLLAVMTDPTGQRETYRYDAQDRLCGKTDRNGTETKYTHNIYNSLTERRARKTDGMKPSGEGSRELTESYRYTPEGLLESAISQGMRYNYAYDVMGRLTEKKASGRTLLAFEYDLNGNLTRQTDVTGKVTEYRYDLADNISEVWDDGKKLAEYAYNADNTVRSLRNGSLYTEYAYDADRNLTGLKTMLGTDIIVNNRYTYDGNGNRLEKLQKHGVTTYGYDNMKRLVKVEYPNATEELFYDKAGNRTKRLYNGTEELYRYDPRNRLTEHIKGGVSTQYEYDNAGNLLKDDKARYEYDAFNRNTKAETFDGNIQINRYDAEGLRHEMEENGKLVTFIFRGNEVVTEESQEDRIRYIRTGVLLASDAESARTYYHYASDEMSSITHVVEGTEVLNHYEYDAWGNLTTCEEKVQNRFKFNGQQYDSVTQQYYLRARYYNPVIARFTQEDTYRGDGLNLYAYCRNNPVYYVDPSGNICETAANRIMDKFDGNGECYASRKEQKKLASYLRNKQNQGGTLTPSEARILNQINDYTAASKYGNPSPSHIINNNGQVNIDTYYNMTHGQKVPGEQAHHLSQNAAFKQYIPKDEGMSIGVKGNAFKDKGSEHYDVHKSMETFWNDYRKGGSKYGQNPTVGQYNRAMYDSLVYARFTNSTAAYAQYRASAQQKQYGLNNSTKLMYIPRRMGQKK